MIQLYRDLCICVCVCVYVCVKFYRGVFKHIKSDLHRLPHKKRWPDISAIMFWKVILLRYYYHAVASRRQVHKNSDRPCVRPCSCHYLSLSAPLFWKNFASRILPLKFFSENNTAMKERDPHNEILYHFLNKLVDKKILPVNNTFLIFFL